MTIRLSCVFFFLLLGGCATKAPTTSPTTAAPSLSPSQSTSEVSIDYPALQRHLGLDKDRETLGFFEKSFNTCDAGNGFSRSQNCRQENFVVLQIQLLCRDSEGTISQVLTAQDLRPLDYRQVRWSLKGIQGTVTSDDKGFVQILTTSRRSQRKERVRIAVGNEFLYMRAADIRQVITPKPWCDQR